MEPRPRDPSYKDEIYERANIALREQILSYEKTLATSLRMLGEERRMEEEGVTGYGPLYRYTNEELRIVRDEMRKKHLKARGRIEERRKAQRRAEFLTSPPDIESEERYNDHLHDIARRELLQRTRESDISRRDLERRRKESGREKPDVRFISDIDTPPDDDDDHDDHLPDHDDDGDDDDVLKRLW